MVAPEGKFPVGMWHGDIMKLVGRTYGRLFWRLQNSFAGRVRGGETSQAERRRRRGGGERWRRRQSSTRDGAWADEIGAERTEGRGCYVKSRANVGRNHRCHFRSFPSSYCSNFHTFRALDNGSRFQLQVCFLVLAWIVSVIRSTSVGYKHIHKIRPKIQRALFQTKPMDFWLQTVDHDRWSSHFYVLLFPPGCFLKCSLLQLFELFFFSLTTYKIIKIFHQYKIFKNSLKKLRVSNCNFKT